MAYKFKANAKYYLSGREIDNIEIEKGLMLHVLLADFQAAIESPERKGVNYFFEKIGIAHKMGFRTLKKAIKSVYLDTKSGRKTAKIFKMQSYYGVFNILRKYGIKINPKGGDNHNVIYRSNVVKILQPQAECRGISIDDLIKETLLIKNKNITGTARKLKVSAPFIKQHGKRLGVL